MSCMPDMTLAAVVVFRIDKIIKNVLHAFEICYKMVYYTLYLG